MGVFNCCYTGRVCLVWLILSFCPGVLCKPCESTKFWCVEQCSYIVVVMVFEEMFLFLVCFTQKRSKLIASFLSLWCKEDNWKEALPQCKKPTGREPAGIGGSCLEFSHLRTFLKRKQRQCFHLALEWCFQWRICEQFTCISQDCHKDSFTITMVLTCFWTPITTKVTWNSHYTLQSDREQWIYWHIVFSNTAFRNYYISWGWLIDWFLSSRT